MHSSLPMDLFGETILEFIGAFFRWLCLNMIYAVSGQELVSFREIWEGPKKSRAKIRYELEALNIRWGIVAVVCAIAMAVWLGI